MIVSLRECSDRGNSGGFVRGACRAILGVFVKQRPRRLADIGRDHLSDEDGMGSIGHGRNPAAGDGSMGRGQIKDAILVALPTAVTETLLRRQLAAEAIRKRDLVLRQHVDDEIGSAQQQFMQKGTIVQTDQQRRRLHRNRGDGRDRHAVIALITGGAGGDNSYSCRETPHRRTEILADAFRRKTAQAKQC
ncbi:Hypothetical protein AT6N2_L1427 [Agrobacterium tumefaciens]|nr:Hypothetical protein AT6N2_L1427 [Agrobacterium tumefaciens]